MVSNNNLNKQFFNTILSQAFSPCGNYLAVGDIYGRVSVYHLSKILEPGSSKSINKDHREHSSRSHFVVKEDFQINSLLSTQSFLVVGTTGEINGYPWKSLKSNKSVTTSSWTIELPSGRDNFSKADVNSLAFNEESGMLYVGCGDNRVYVYDLETRRLLRTLDEHKDYVHQVALWGSGGSLISAGEDGQAIIWDTRSRKSVQKIEPHLNDKVRRDGLGKWLGAVDLIDDWIVCGGGPRLSLWHSRFLSNSIVFPIEDGGMHVAKFVKDKVFAGGRSSYFYQMNFNGEVVTEIPTSAVTTYCAVYREEPCKALCIAGSSPFIDVSSTAIYRDLQLLVDY